MRFGALISYHYINGKVPTVLPRYTVLDSGAFSAQNSGAKIGLVEYAGFAKRHRMMFTWVAGLDTIGDPETTWDAWRAMPTSVPTLHLNSDPDWLDRMAAKGTRRVAFGGLVPHMRAHGRIMPWLESAHIRAQKLGLDVHAFGVSNSEVLGAFPWASADSTSYLRWGFQATPRVWRNGAWCKVEDHLPVQVLKRLIGGLDGRSRRIRLGISEHIKMIRSVVIRDDFSFYFAAVPTSSKDYSVLTSELRTVPNAMHPET